MTTTTLPSGTGNLTARGSDSFAWDYEDRMTSATVNSVTTAFFWGEYADTTDGSTRVAFRWPLG